MEINNKLIGVRTNEAEKEKLYRQCSMLGIEVSDVLREMIKITNEILRKAIIENVDFSEYEK